MYTLRRDYTSTSSYVNTAGSQNRLLFSPLYRRLLQEQLQNTSSRTSAVLRRCSSAETSASYKRCEHELSPQPPVFATEHKSLPSFWHDFRSSIKQNVTLHLGCRAPPPQDGRREICTCPPKTVLDVNWSRQTRKGKECFNNLHAITTFVVLGFSFKQLIKANLA